MLDAPHAMAAFNIIAADTDAEAEFLASSLMQSFVALRTGNPCQLPPPVEGYVASLPPHFASALHDVLSASAIGAADTVKSAVLAFQARTQADEIIVACSVFDHEKRKRSLEIAAEVFGRL
jgi:alkanesulfonate monooxygenase SsuD/methylene tetrahydromethanopterin reductase-like flavin-dependent oxidoreductase (luciferase family)